MRKISFTFNDVNVRQGKIYFINVYKSITFEKTCKTCPNVFLCDQIFLFHCEYGKTKKETLYYKTFIIIRMASVYCNASPFTATLFLLDMTTGRVENLSIMGKWLCPKVWKRLCTQAALQMFS